MPGTVLVVEDEVDLAGLLTEVLEAVGYTVVLTTGRKAAERTRDIQPCLVVTDFVMPGLNGAQVVQAIRADNNGSAPPILLVTGMDDAARLAADVGADGYLRKPFDVDAFVSLVDRLAGPGG